MNPLDEARALQRRVDRVSKQHAAARAALDARYEAKRAAILQGASRAALAVLEAAAVADDEARKPFVLTMDNVVLASEDGDFPEGKRNLSPRLTDGHI